MSFPACAGESWSTPNVTRSQYEIQNAPNELNATALSPAVGSRWAAVRAASIDPSPPPASPPAAFSFTRRVYPVFGDPKQRRRMSEPTDAYAAAGVDQRAADAAVAALVAALAQTRLDRPSRTVHLPGHYASVIRLDERTGLAMSTD